MNNSAKILFVLAAGWLTTTAFAQDRIHIQEKNYQILLITTGNCLR